MCFLDHDLWLYGLELCFLHSLEVQNLTGSEGPEGGTEEKSEGRPTGVKGDGIVQFSLPIQHKMKSGNMLVTGTLGPISPKGLMFIRWS